MSATALTYYRLALALAEPLAPLLLRCRAARGKEDPHRLGERLGRPSLERPTGLLVWMHGASIGETLSLLPLIDRLHADRPDIKLLVTSGTATSANLLARRLPGNVPHQYAPIDTPRAVTRFLDVWHPDLAILAEGDLWPNLLLSAKARGNKLALVSARITKKTADGWARYPKSAAAVFGALDLVLPQNDASAQRLQDLGVTVHGRLNLKLTSAPLPLNGASVAEVEAQAGARPLLLAASTHTGEDEVVLDAFAQADPERKGVLVIVPRHTERGLGIANLARAHGFTAGLRSRGDTLAGRQIYVADSLGELGLWFRVARAAYIGGGLSKRIGGHNPLEAVRLDCPVISGPNVRNWAEVYDSLRALQAVMVVNSSQELAVAFAAFLSSTDTGAAQSERARAFIDNQAAAFDAGWELILPLLPAAF